MNKKTCKTCGQTVVEEVKQIIPAETLIWGPDSDREMNWKDAVEWCKEQGGRLPTRSELIRAIDENVVDFSRPDYTFWSSTESSGNSANAWIVSLANGGTGSTTKTNMGYVRCVRRGK